MELEYTKKNYEISIYKNELSNNYTNIPSNVNQISYFKQNKIATIGTNKYKNPADACSPVFTSNINGSNTLTFTIYYQYLDSTSGEYLPNPIVDHIHNDTLVKFTLEDEVYDLLVTDISKNSADKSFKYTAEDANIIELGKNGFSAELSTELQNNMGTVTEVGEKILEGSDWKVAPVDRNISAPFYSDLLIQTLEDSLYKIQVTNLINFTKRTNYIPDAYYVQEVKDFSGTSITGTIYAFYNDVHNQNTSELGFLYFDGGEPILNADGLIVNSYNYITTKDDLAAEISTKELSILRGRRVVRSVKTFYDNSLERVMTYFKSNRPNDNRVYYGYAETDYNSPTLVENYLSNPCNMTSLYDWGYINSSEKVDPDPKLLLSTMPRASGAPYVTYMKLGENSEVINKGLQGHRTNIESLIKGDQFVLAFLHRTEGYKNNIGDVFPSPKLEDFGFKAGFYRYTDEENNYIESFKSILESEPGYLFSTNKGEYIQFTNSPLQEFVVEDTLDKRKKRIYRYMVIPFNPAPVDKYDHKDYNIQDLTEGYDRFLGAFFYTKTEQPLYEAMFFEKKLFKGKLVYPGRIPEETEELYQTHYNIYTNEDERSVLVDRFVDGLSFEGVTYTPIYNESCEKINSVTGREKNYYTLLNELTKAFECWMTPKIARDEYGNIQYENYYYANNRLLEFSDEPLAATLDNIGKCFIKNNKLSYIRKKELYKWIRLEANDDVTNEFNEYWSQRFEDLTTSIDESDLDRIPVKVIPYFGNFEQFTGANGKLINKFYTKDQIQDYSTNHAYIVYYWGTDTEAAPYHPKKEYYRLERVFSAEFYTPDDTNNELYVLKKPSKWIVIRNYLNDTPNWAGFKYGLNVDSINRKENSKDLSSKVIVKNNSNEFANDKFCSIARAENNPTKDNFIIDFGYYVRQKLLDRENLYNDLYLNYFPRLREINEQNQTLINEQKWESIELTHAQSEFDTYFLAYNAAQESIAEYCKKIRNCGEKYTINLEGWNIGGLEPVMQDTYIILSANSYEDMVSPTNSDIFAGVDVTAGEMAWHDLKAIYYYNGSFYTNINGERAFHIFDQDNYYYMMITDEELLTTINKRFERNEYEFKPYRTYKIKKREILGEYQNKTNYYWNRGLYGYACQIDELLIKKEVYGPKYQAAEIILKALKVNREERFQLSKELMEEKKGILRQFYSKYSAFIRESNWVDNKYIDDELYYLDARDSLHAAAFPKISYDIKVNDISEVEGYDCYNLKVGDYTFIEDTEFFGWDINGRPAKEWVVVTEATQSLETPEKNTIKIQNYKTQLESLFSRISASLQEIKLNTGGYNREIRDTVLPGGIKLETNGIYSSNYNQELGTGWALFNDGKWFLGETSEI